VGADTPQARRIGERLGEHLLLPPARFADTLELVISAGAVPEVMRVLHDDPALRYELLSDICGVDTGATMQVVYHLWSPLAAEWLRVIADGLSRDDPRVPSVTFLWPGAEWGEREAYDMLGIEFEGNRDLRRIYMPPDYLAFPLRKDFVLADDAARGPGEGIRHMERAHAPAEARASGALRSSPGTGAVLGPAGERLRLAPGDAAAIPAGQPGPGRPRRGKGQPGSDAAAGP
jgi:NADH:ubiquinone oxidoreductase subunit C